MLSLPTIAPADGVSLSLFHRRIIPWGQDYACSTDANNHSSSACGAVSQHRLLPTGQEQNAYFPQETSEASFSNSLNALGSCTNNAQRSMMPPSTAYDDANNARASRKRSWRAQGLLAGEWRDRFGRHRRAGHSVYHSDKQRHGGSSPLAADLSMASVPCSSTSCAGTEVSFEGLIEELRKRLPNSSSSLLEMVAAQHNADASVFETTPSLMATGTAKNLDREIRGGGGAGDTLDMGAAGGGGGHRDTSNNNTWSNSGDENIRRASFSPLRRRGTTRGNSIINNPQQRRLPRGCLQLRPMVEPFRASPSRQVLSGVSGRLRQAAVGSNASPWLESCSRGEGGNSKYDEAVTMYTASEENVSPSAAMVAAAKAQERALPLLQVCAVKLAEPAGA